MSFKITCTDHQLETSELFSLASAAPGMLTVKDGTVWLTRGDGEDLIIGVGECAAFATGDTQISTANAGLATFETAAASSATPAQAA